MTIWRRGIVLAVLAVSACAAPGPRSTPAIAVPPGSVARATPAAVEPALDPAEARASAADLIAKARLKVYSTDDEAQKRAIELGLDETRARRLAEAIAKSCLDANDREAKACKAIYHFGPNGDETLETLFTHLGAVAEPDGYTASMKLLVRFDALASRRARVALDNILERRMASKFTACSPPTAAELAASAASLGDFVVVESSPPGPSQASKPVARKPTPTELGDLAYFMAAIARRGVAVASTEEDDKAKPLPAGAPAHAAREALRTAMANALVRGDLEQHATLARQYLTSLGYPGKIREAEEGDERWGGRAYSYVMRELARSEEILGRRDDAEALYRRANPGGGVCGTTNASRHAHQIQGAIRAAEAAGRCHAVIVERLFSVDPTAVYGTSRLAAAGFDVARLYRGALLTLGRKDGDPEAWAARTRAIPGYAAEAKTAAVPLLLALARRGTAQDGVEIMDAIGRLIEDHGQDPCLGGGWISQSNDMPREILSLRKVCNTKLKAAESDKIVTALAGFAPDPRPELREAVAIALGRTGRPSARGVLRRLARDIYTTGNQSCRSVGGGPEKCGPDHPVRAAAEDALALVDEAETSRADERAQAREEASAAKAAKKAGSPPSP